MQITPYTLDFPDAQLGDLRRRLAATGWLANYWLDAFDWRQEDAALDRYPQFMAEVDGQRIHFFHVRSADAADAADAALGGERIP